MTRIEPRHLAALVGMNLVWGFNFVVSKHAVSHFPPVLFTLLRFALLALLLLPFLRWHEGRMVRLLLAASLSGGLQFALLFAGLRYMDGVASAAIATQLGVPFTTLLSIVFLGEAVHWRRWLGIGLAFAGVAVIGFQPGLFEHRTGVALVVASALASSTGLIAVKTLGTSLKPLELQAWFAWSSAPLLLGLTLALETGQRAAIASAGWVEWGAVLYTALLASLVAHSGFYYLVGRYPVTSIAPLTLLSPAFGVAFGVLLLGEPVTPRLAAGAALTFAGVLIIALRERRLAATGRSRSDVDRRPS
jgi:O-acetylserine/cysteine efflux transporter